MFRKISIIIISLLLFTVCQKSESKDQHDLSVFGLNSVATNPNSNSGSGSGSPNTNNTGNGPGSNPNPGGGWTPTPDPLDIGEVSPLTNPNILIPACGNSVPILEFGGMPNTSSKVDLGNGNVWRIAGSDTSLVMEYDPNLQLWNGARNFNLSRIRYRHTASLLNNGKVLIAGGIGWDNQYDYDFLSSVELVDPNFGGVPQVSFGSDMQIPRYGHRSHPLPNGNLLVHGVSNNTDLTQGAEIYNPNSDTWSFTNPVNFVRVEPMSVLLQDGRVLVAGGWGPTQNADPSKTAEIYNPANNSWTSVSDLNLPRIDSTAILLADGKVLVAGGTNANNGQYISDMEIYDPNTNQWTTFEMPVSRVEFTMDLLGDGSVLFLAGRNDAYVVHNLRYFPNTNTWCRAPDLQYKRYAQHTSVLPNGSVLVFGGRSTSY
ncbi:kelch repeat protein [Leptospira weilii serovar Topaz str. LT2116]|uniref:Kelch repeat protein n=1 Tax=Leptospira weilii serovar Topaz str. LT2116 TaxID=1088540 RepID=M3G2E9_9LEPT|nr:kelch repeat protein [Leptospira weilii serovar Topaz str. LT2116]